jgi:hypothetical protein
MEQRRRRGPVRGWDVVRDNDGKCARPGRGTNDRGRLLCVDRQGCLGGLRVNFAAEVCRCDGCGFAARRAMGCHGWARRGCVGRSRRAGNGGEEGEAEAEERQQTVRGRVCRGPHPFSIEGDVNCVGRGQENNPTLSTRKPSRTWGTRGRGVDEWGEGAYGVPDVQHGGPV